ncbi:DUF7507 domain-containing protein [Octadecabacter ascidiaceicola]|uniref:DUF7507 domain-containing protein n=1 Tax=Octadecabacter ascidiaceicola TaxID=1655543 RepID=A0A238KE97_9RHOB|nr:DUF11 domain-containing protein [Octadecabacter ascidiaceicola]SMX41119.1 hypothetical protein OCA8868_02399 [Octadecabacter ascidiaceicola]
MLDNILTTGQTVSQVYDDDPNDNYWDFRRGPTLGNGAIETIAPGYELEKTVAGGATEFFQVGETITYNYVVRNIGSVDIFNVAVTDDKIGAVTCSPTTLDRTTSSSQPPNEALCSADYIVIQEDFDSQTLTNNAQATGDPEFGSLGPLTDTVTLTGPALNPAMTLDKVATPSTFSAVGETITYDFTVTNTGNATLSDVVVTDPLIPFLSCSVSTLLPVDAGTNVFTSFGANQVTQDDVDNYINSGQTLDNTATVNANDPNDTALVPVDGTETLNGPAADPTFTITKTPTPTTYSAAGETISYSFLITNSGNVTLTDIVTITDLNLTPTTLTCPAAGPVNIAPGGTVTCTATWSPEQSDIDAGSFTNSVTVATTFAGNPVVTDPLDPATATATAIETPAMEMVKSLTGLEDPLGNPTSVFASGNVAVYDYTITNTGNTTLAGPITIDDNLIGTVACPAGDLAPTDPPLVCSASYTITTDDVELGSVTNIATATDSDGTESPPVDETVPGNVDPSISMVKEADVATFSAVGDPIVYTYTVTNTSPGAVVGGILVRPALENAIVIRDDKISGDISCLPTADNRLSPDEMTTCTAAYFVTQDDLDAVVILISCLLRSMNIRPTKGEHSSWDRKPVCCRSKEHPVWARRN